MPEKSEILATALKRFTTIQTEQSVYRPNSLENIKFTYNIDGSQWEVKDMADRVIKRRPCLTHNKLEKFVKQVANRQRDQRMSQKVKGIDDQADPIIADILTQYIHAIEHQSEATEIYTNAGEQALAGGYGYWRILTEYVDDSFDQEIRIVGIDNQYSVYLDPKGRYGFIRESMTKDEFKEQYPDSEPVDVQSHGVGEDYENWYEEDTVYIAEYFYRKPKEKTIAEVVHPDDIDGFPEIIELKDNITVKTLEAQGIEVLRTRVVQSHTIKWCKISGTDVIEGYEGGEIRDWVGKEIPIIECKGNEVNVAGKVYKRAVIENGKDPQRMYNYWITAQTERGALAPKAHYMVTPEEIEGHEPMWDEANVENRAYLLYNNEGHGKPARTEPPLVDQGAVSMMNVGDRDIQDTLGMYESTFGQRSNERTGKAIIARSSRSDMGTYHFTDNLARAIRKTTRQLIDIIPKIIDTNRMLRVRDYKGAEALVEVNKPILTDSGEIAIVNDLSLGKFDLEEDVKIWSTRREEAAVEMGEAMQYAPMIAPIIAAYKFKYSDVPGAKELEGEIRDWMKRQEANQAQELSNKKGG